MNELRSHEKLLLVIAIAVIFWLHGRYGSAVTAASVDTAKAVASQPYGAALPSPQLVSSYAMQGDDSVLDAPVEVDHSPYENYF